MSKKINYFKQGYMGNRPDIMKMIPVGAKTFLDVGCGAGGLGTSITNKIPNAEITGVDSDPRLIEIAKTHFNKTLLADINSQNFWDNLEDDSFDIIIFSDVLEHLIDPYSVLKIALTKLNKNGLVITCIPNIRHYSTFYFLFVKGTWPAKERGLFDKTHLHFYTRKDIIFLFNQVGLEIIKENRNVRLVEPWSWTNIPGLFFDFWPFRSIFTFQYIHLCKAKNPNKL